MNTTCREILNIGFVILLPVVFVVSCTTSSERTQSQPASESEEKTTAAAAKTTAESATPSAAAKTEVSTPAKAADVPEVKDKTVKPVPVAAPSTPTMPRSSIYLGSDGKMAGIGDPSKPASEAYRIGMGIRPAALAGAGLPKDRFGLIDWVAVVKQGEINPIDSLDPNAPKLPPFDMDVVIKAKGDFVNDVVFPHNAHTYWLGCDNCHPGIFIMAKGQNKMSMVGISEGKWCGRCHGKVAFPLTDCSRCHVQEKINPGEEQSAGN